mmetsp:Transcript_35114/g.74902  ORF Transcript_35114/g.74902 Transcript_35114/m.74902 type:complete len:305 (+) Transcript_35114:166-1080(+)
MPPNPLLKERLIHCPEAELSSSTGERERAKLEQSIKRMRLEYPDESLDQRTREGVDMVIVLGSVIIVAISIIGCAVSMLLYPSSTFELLFALSITQGPYAIFQRLQLIAFKPKREAIAMLWKDSKIIKQKNYVVETEIAAMLEDVERLRTSLSRYEPYMDGYDIEGFRYLYEKNERIKQEKKLLAEVIGLEKLTKSILSTDPDRDHYIGDAELALLARRIESIEGVPFTSDEVCERFRRGEEGEARSLRNLADAVRILYIEKRREYFASARAKAKEGADRRSPRNLGHPMFWKRKLEDIDIAVC